MLCLQEAYGFYQQNIWLVPVPTWQTSNAESMGGNAARAKRRRVGGSAKQRIQKKKSQRILRNAKTSGWGFRILRCTASDEEKSRSVFIQSQQWLSAWSDLCICLGRWSVTLSTRKSRTELEGASPVQ